MIELALFEPEIPQNTGTLLRVGACFGLKIHLIEPCGFIFSSRRMKRAGMDYIDQVDYEIHNSWEEFHSTMQQKGKRTILLTPHTNQSYLDFSYATNDVLILGRESDGVPTHVAKAVDNAVVIPMKNGTRSLNVAISGGIVVSEALRQIT